EALFGCETRVRFTFERFYDYLMGEYVLRQHVRLPLDKAGVKRLESQFHLAEEHDSLSGPLASLLQTLVEKKYPREVAECVARCGLAAGRRAAEALLFDLGARNAVEWPAALQAFGAAGCLDPVLEAADRLAHSGRYASSRAAYE